MLFTNMLSVKSLDFPACCMDAAFFPLLEVKFRLEITSRLSILCSVTYTALQLSFAVPDSKCRRTRELQIDYGIAGTALTPGHCARDGTAKMDVVLSSFHLVGNKQRWRCSVNLRLEHAYTVIREHLKAADYTRNPSWGLPGTWFDLEE